MAFEETERHADPTRPGSGGASGQATIDDLGDSLSTIREHYQKPLITLLLDIQETKIQSPKSMKFVQELECLFLLADNNTRSLGARPTEPKSAHPTATFARKHINAFREGEYVALSYTWEPYLQLETYGQYYVEPRNREGRPKKSKVRDSVFERIIKYMNRFNLRYLWIDKECIAQEDSKEKEIAVQAMDQVYNCSIHPIGLLYQPIQSIAELKLLARLMTWDFIEKSESGFELDPEFLEESKCNTLELLEAIVSDVWWTRAWIYQENYRGGTNMKLLIPHRIPQEDYQNRGPYVELFGDIPGEIILESTKFHEAATAFCLALSKIFQHAEDDDCLGRGERLVLRLLAKRIKHKGIREDIYGFLKCVDTPEYGGSFVKEYQRYMAKELVTAVNEGKHKRLRLAALWHPNGWYSPYRAIFICDRSEPEGSPSYAFTASREGQSNDSGRLINDIDKHVSLAVDFFGENERTPFLYTRRWMHGLCFFYGCPRIEAVFPWPSALSEI
ncbi:hypothetical protein NUW58_g7982 [Xylaria curta]|uniref:Uncharacterized protein n=1 Tax=Xylaria curta TaxID=42375 RepID=A0ACC1NEN4_9PEZI|nr:hypothetical protein NUW58_g7982 [Xylaria curta]